MEYRVGRAVVRIEMIPGEGAVCEWDPPPRTWRRASRFVDLLGPDKALELMDERAERAMFDGRPEAALLWRDLMVAVHRMSREERLGDERDH